MYVMDQGKKKAPFLVYEKCTFLGFKKCERNFGPQSRTLVVLAMDNENLFWLSSVIIEVTQEWG